MFHPLVESWFAETYTAPTPVQKEAWPLIAKGENVLAVAPTGSGKTLAAFLVSISRFIDGTWDPARLCCLYVSPLKALNEDIKRNLIEPVESLRKKAAAGPRPKAGFSGPEDRPLGAFPDIRVETRSGDTPQAERRRFLLRPPSILAVTPESLAILLLNPRGREVLSTLRCLVLDEIHAVMGTKRGAFLSSQIDRLSLVAGEFQRVALSATVNPLEQAAEFAGGLAGGAGNYKKREMRIVAPAAEKRIDFLVEFPRDLEYSEASAKESAEKFAAEKTGFGETTPDRYSRRYTILINYILERIRALDGAGGGKRSTLLVFTDSRRRCERISHLLNQAAGERISLCHHGSLSKEIRRDVEQSLAEGRIPCVVATSSLELGIDVGAVDEVILAGSVSSSAQTLQRIGRAGHGVARISRARFVPFLPMDIINGAAIAGAVAEKEIEETRPVKNPLDILAQIVLALAAEKPRTSAELYAIVKGFGAFSELEKSNFDQVIAMLAGRYTDGKDVAGERDASGENSAENGGSDGGENTARLREIKPRLLVDIDGSCHAAAGVVSLLYLSGGVIPNRGLYSMRLPDGTRIGELDEEFVFERRPGDSFDFGAHSWSIVDIGDEAITVIPLERDAGFQPFWKADTPFRSPVLTRRVLDMFDNYENSAGKAPPVFPCLSEEAAEALGDLLEKQRDAQGAVRLPGRAYIPVEIIDSAARPDSYRIVFHSFRGGALNYPLGFALAGLLEETTGTRVETIINDNAILLLVSRPLDPEALIGGLLLELAGKGEACFRGRLESSGIFGAAFREAAEISMIINRGNFGRRVPLWVTRRQAKRLYDKVSGRADFPAVTEAWRICLADRFDMNGFRELLENLADGTVKMGVFRTSSPSPFSRDLSWKETGAFMYEYDERNDILGRPGKAGDYARSSLADRAVADAIGDPRLRPRLPALNEFGAKLRRELSGWAPEDPLSLAEWVRERVAIPADEWETLAGFLPAELREELRRDPGLDGRIAEITLDGAEIPVVVHSALLAAPRPAAFLSRLGEWLRYEGPVSSRRIAAVFGCGEAEAKDAAEALVEAGEAAGGIRAEGAESADDLYCDAENFDLLLRLARKQARPRIRERPAALLAPFLSLRQGIIPKADRSGDSAFAALSCYAAPAPLWETEILPARIWDYKPEILDGALGAARLVWLGAEKERIAFCAPDELELIWSAPGPDGPRVKQEAALRAIAAFCGRYRNFWEIRDELVRSGLVENIPGSAANGSAAGLIWKAVWASLISSDSFEAVRRGLERGFNLKTSARDRSGRAAGNIPGITPRCAPSGSRGSRFVPRALREKWREGAPLPGNWFSLLPEPEYDPRARPGGSQSPDALHITPDAALPDEFSALEEAELNRDRVRLLLRRWGILAKPFFERENPAFSWSSLLPAMRRMELAGELVTGRFVEGIHSLQFASPAIAAELEAAGDVSAVYWMNAADPASPAGLAVDGLDRRLPPRTAGARLCFRGGGLAAVSTKNGRELEIFVPPGSVPEIAAFIKAPRTRVCGPVRKLVIETINGQNAAASPWADPLIEAGFIADRGRLFLW
ncbi:MAG: DEAD/DEAH box helicase [Treponema sp.]|jgi:ATP-dependent Lhr-like helicase|nr:DEAD/DEAH box helicase [Treponema sp.]